MTHKICIHAERKILTYESLSMAGNCVVLYRGAGKSLARPGRKQATATEDFELLISYL
jgi:hypothetical protein